MLRSVADLLQLEPSAEMVVSPEANFSYSSVALVVPLAPLLL